MLAEVDDILPNAHNCPMLTNASEDVLHSAESQQFEAQVNELLGEMSKLLGQTYTFSDLGLVWDCLHTHICHQFPIPDVITQEMFDKISNYTLFSNQFSAGYNNSRVARLGMGPLISEMYGNMKAVSARVGRVVVCYGATAVADACGHGCTCCADLERHGAPDEVRRSPWSQPERRALCSLCVAVAAGLACPVLAMYGCGCRSDMSCVATRPGSGCTLATTRDPSCRSCSRTTCTWTSGARTRL